MHISTPKPIMVAWSPRGGFIAWECLTDGITCEAALIRLTETENYSQRIKLIRKVAIELGLFHDRGAEHGDLKSSNILVLDIESKNPRVYFTDVDASKFYHFLPFARRVRDLARLYAALYPFVSNFEVRYFLRRYLKMQSDDINLRQLIVAVRDRAEKKIIQKHLK
jgi:tRNA A-37 threonylcarbamoyl transferase component Bud32